MSFVFDKLSCISYFFHQFEKLSSVALKPQGGYHFERAPNRDSAYGFAACYDLPMGLSFGVAYNEAKLDGLTENTVSDRGKKAKSAIVGAKYEADKLYAALTYAELKDRNAHDYLRQVDKAEGYELYVSYQFQDNLKIETGYNQLSKFSKTAGRTTRKMT